MNTLYPQHNCFQKDSVTHLSKTKQEVNLKVVFNRFKWGIFMLYMHRFTYQYDRILQPTSEREIQVTERYSSMSMRIFFGTLRTRIHSQMCLVLLLPQESCLGSESDLRQLGEGHSDCDWALERERYDMKKIYGVYLLRDEVQKCNDPSLCTFYLPHWKCSPRKNEHFTYNYI